MSFLLTKRRAGYPISEAAVREQQCPKPAVRVAADRAPSRLADNGRCEPIEVQLAGFQYVGNIFRH